MISGWCRQSGWEKMKCDISRSKRLNSTVERGPTKSVISNIVAILGRVGFLIWWSAPGCLEIFWTMLSVPSSGRFGTKSEQGICSSERYKVWRRSPIATTVHRGQLLPDLGKFLQAFVKIKVTRGSICIGERMWTRTKGRQRWQRETSSLASSFCTKGC